MRNETKIEVECPKCWGKKTIDGCYHVENGVCFCCSGEGTIMVSPSKAKEMGPTEYQIKRAEWILTCTKEQLIKLSFQQISKARTFAHGGFGLQRHFPTMLKVWREKCEAVFQAKQERKLEAYYQENPIYSATQTRRER